MCSSDLLVQDHLPPGVRARAAVGDRRGITHVPSPLLHAVTSELLRNDVVVTNTQVDQASLDDAFLALTGRTFDDANTLSQEEMAHE